MKRYGLKGIDDEETTCSVCGKIELKRVMWIVELNEEGEELGDPFHCGTTCGAKLMQQKLNKVTKIVNSYASKVDSIRWNMMNNKEHELGANKIIKTLNEETKTFEERRNHPLWQELWTIKQQAQTWAEQQEIIIEIV